MKTLGKTKTLFAVPKIHKSYLSFYTIIMSFQTRLKFLRLNFKQFCTAIFFISRFSLKFHRLDFEIFSSSRSSKHLGVSQFLKCGRRARDQDYTGGRLKISHANSLNWWHRCLPYLYSIHCDMSICFIQLAVNFNNVCLLAFRI